MKIITWNCNMAFRKKANIILEHHPDILIVPECEHPEKIDFINHIQKPTHSIWYGDNKNKGIGIFSYSAYNIKVLDNHDHRFKYIIPINIKNSIISFTLFAIWANNPKDPDGNYITQVWKAINHYETILSDTKTVLIGDFNSNTIWDKPRREGNHSTLVKKLESKGIISAYHKYYKQKQGNEEHPTLFMYRRKENPYHIDYCFVSNDFATAIKSVEIGSYEQWIKYSDHTPLIITIDTNSFIELE